MKKLLVLLLLALPAFGDVTITNTYTDGQAARITRAMNRVNRDLCTYFGKPASCNTTQVRQVFCQRNGFGGQPIKDENGNVIGTTPLVSDCNGATQFIIYPSLETFAKRELLRLSTEQYASAEAAEDRAAAKAAWDAKTQAQKDAICTSLGLPAGCTAF